MSLKNGLRHTTSVIFFLTVFLFSVGTSTSEEYDQVFHALKNGVSIEFQKHGDPICWEDERRLKAIILSQLSKCNIVENPKSKFTLVLEQDIHLGDFHLKYGGVIKDIDLCVGGIGLRVARSVPLKLFKAEFGLDHVRNGQHVLIYLQREFGTFAFQRASRTNILAKMHTWVESQTSEICKSFDNKKLR